MLYTIKWPLLYAITHPLGGPVYLAVEQSGEEPLLVSSGCSTVRTEKASAEDTHRRECPHDVVGLHVHKGTMWMSNDCVPLKNVESPYGGGVSPLLGAAGGCSRAGQ